MVALFGRTYSPRELAAHAGMVAKLGGVRLLTLGEEV